MGSGPQRRAGGALMGGKGGRVYRGPIFFPPTGIKAQCATHYSPLDRAQKLAAYTLCSFSELVFKSQEKTVQHLTD